MFKKNIFLFPFDNWAIDCPLTLEVDITNVDLHSQLIIYISF